MPYKHYTRKKKQNIRYEYNNSSLVQKYIIDLKKYQKYSQKKRKKKPTGKKS